MAKPKTKPLSIKLPEEMYNSLVKMSVKEKTIGGLSGQVRKYIKKGLELDGFIQDENLLYQLIKKSIDDVLPPRIERIIQLNAKTTIASATSLFLNINTTAKLIHPSKRDDYKEMLSKAEKFAIKYQKAKTTALFDHDFPSSDIQNKEDE